MSLNLNGRINFKRFRYRQKWEGKVYVIVLSDLYNCIIHTLHVHNKEVHWSTQLSRSVDHGWSTWLTVYCTVHTAVFEQMPRSIVTVQYNWRYPALVCILVTPSLFWHMLDVRKQEEEEERKKKNGRKPGTKRNDRVSFKSCMHHVTCRSSIRLRFEW